MAVMCLPLCVGGGLGGRVYGECACVRARVPLCVGEGRWGGREGGKGFLMYVCGCVWVFIVCVCPYMNCATDQPHTYNIY